MIPQRGVSELLMVHVGARSWGSGTTFLGGLPGALTGDECAYLGPRGLHVCNTVPGGQSSRAMECGGTEQTEAHLKGIWNVPQHPGLGTGLGSLDNLRPTLMGSLSFQCELLFTFSAPSPHQVHGGGSRPLEGKPRVMDTGRTGFRPTQHTIV